MYGGSDREYVLYGERRAQLCVFAQRDGSSSLRSPSKPRARWGLFRSNQPRRPVCSTLKGNYRSVPIGIGTYGGPTEEQQAGPKPEIPGSRCQNPLSTCPMGTIPIEPTPQTSVRLPYSSVTISSEPTEPLRDTSWPVKLNSSILAAGVSAPCQLNKN